MTEHGYITLKDGAELRIPLRIAWRDRAEQRGISEKQFIIEHARWWHESEVDTLDENNIESVRIETR